MKTPYVFDEFFAKGREESASPFLTARSRGWARGLGLKRSILSATLLALAFGFSFMNVPLSHFFLALTYMLAGAPALIATCNDLKTLEINIDVLMTLAAFLAVAIGSGLEGALLLVLFDLSHGLEETVSHKARSAIHNLNNLAPKLAHVVAEGGASYTRAVRDIAVGEKLLIKQGEIVPLDGKVVDGISSLNLVHLTGESVPQRVTVGAEVAAGGRNLESALVIEVMRHSRDSTIARIIQLIHEAQEAKPKVQRLLDRFGKQYATSVIALTVLFALTLPLPWLGFEGSIYRALAFMIAASPCALIIATPTAYLSAISACAKKGILLKGGVTLDALASCSQIAFDKTGTLTTGQLMCSGIEPIAGSDVSQETALRIAAALERHVVHPIATAISALAENLPPHPLQSVQAVPGSGLEAKLEDGTSLAIGLPEYVAAKLSAQSGELVRRWASSARGQVLTVLSVGEAAFGFRFADQIRPAAPSTLRKIERHLTPVMLTGDHAESAERVGKELGLAAIYANLRPEDKLKRVAELAEQGNLAMVGDGINDAPALARATVGISMGKVGSATAVDASDVVLLNDDLESLGWLFPHAKKTRRIVQQNLALALGIIVCATTPALLGWVPLWLAVILHEGGTVLVGLNSLRLLR